MHASVAPHSIYTCSRKTLEDTAALARKYHAPILIHVAEMKKERDDSEKQNGMSPVQYLDKIGVLGPDVVAAHCIFVDEADRKILAQRSEEHTSELQSQFHLVCRLLLEKKKKQ